jgi:hypothetical protein
VYEEAQRLHAFTRGESFGDGIYYLRDSMILFISLVFKNESDQLYFEDSLRETDAVTRKRSVEGKSLIVEPVVERINFPEVDLKRVLSSQYSQGDTSPPCHSERSTPTASVESNFDSSCRLKVIENDRSFGTVKPFKCHFISRTVKEFVNNPDNIMYMSADFHANFDGNNKYDTKMPSFAIKPISHSDTPEDVGGGVQRYRVVVQIVFRNESERNALCYRLKESMTVVSEDGLVYQTDLFFNDAKTAFKCINVKYYDTITKWGTSDVGDDLEFGDEEDV